MLEYRARAQGVPVFPLSARQHGVAISMLSEVAFLIQPCSQPTDNRAAGFVSKVGAILLQLLLLWHTPFTLVRRFPEAPAGRFHSDMFVCTLAS